MNIWELHAELWANIDRFINILLDIVGPSPLHYVVTKNTTSINSNYNQKAPMHILIVTIDPK